MLIDYHLHNRFSPDGKARSPELLEAEIGHGVEEVCFTNHAEWFELHEEEGGTFTLEEALSRFHPAQKDIEAMRLKYPEIRIKFGVELEYQTRSLRGLEQFLQKLPLDFVLGSVHQINGVLVSGGRHAGEVYDHWPEEKAYTAYFKDVLALVEWDQADAIAHFDICKKFGHLRYGPFKPEKYKDQILPILRAMKQRGTAMELNAGSLHKNCHELFPHPEILKWCVKEGLQYFTFGSDAHETHRAGTYLKEVAAIAKDAGITHVSTYKDRQPTKHPI